MTPVSTSPLPPLANPLPPVVFTRTSPSGDAVTVRWPFSTRTQPWAMAKSCAARSRSPRLRSPPIRANSTSWGVRTVGLPRRASSRSICPERAFMPSASSTSGFSVFRSSHTRWAVSRLRPSPGPSASTSQPSSFSRICGRAFPASMPFFSGSGKGMAETHLAASMGQMVFGTPSDTSPQPVRAAADAVR